MLLIKTEPGYVSPGSFRLDAFQIIPVDHGRHKHIRFIHDIAEVLPDDLHERQVPAVAPAHQASGAVFVDESRGEFRVGAVLVDAEMAAYVDGVGRAAEGVAVQVAVQAQGAALHEGGLVVFMHTVHPGFVLPESDARGA